MLQIMSLGVPMVLHWQRLHRPRRNCNLWLHFHSCVFFLCVILLGKNYDCILFNMCVWNMFSSECQMVMSVLWTRLSETGKDWRYVYKVRDTS